jgi:hypothetical protein
MAATIETAHEVPGFVLVVASQRASDRHAIGESLLLAAILDGDVHRLDEHLRNGEEDKRGVALRCTVNTKDVPMERKPDYVKRLLDACAYDIDTWLLVLRTFAIEMVDVYGYPPSYYRREDLAQYEVDCNHDHGAREVLRHLLTYSFHPSLAPTTQFHNDMIMLSQAVVYAYFPSESRHVAASATSSDALRTQSVLTDLLKKTDGHSLRDVGPTCLFLSNGDMHGLDQVLSRGAIDPHGTALRMACTPGVVPKGRMGEFIKRLFEAYRYDIYVWQQALFHLTSIVRMSGIEATELRAALAVFLEATCETLHVGAQPESLEGGLDMDSVLEIRLVVKGIAMLCLPSEEDEPLVKAAAATEGEPEF